MKPTKMTNQDRFTPLDPNYGSCKSTYASLFIYMKSKDTKTVDELRHLRGNFVVDLRKEFEKGHRSAECLHEYCWSFSSEGKVASKDLRHHLNWLLEMIYEDRSSLFAIQQDESTSMFIYCNWWSKSGHGGPAISPEQMNALVDLNLALTLDFHFDSAGE